MKYFLLITATLLFISLPGILSAQRVATKAAASSLEKPVLFYHHTYNDFMKGVVSESGGNIYISKKGQIQFINLFDLNGDGYPEVVTNNDHNGYDTPDAFVYHNNKPAGLQSLSFPFAKDAAVYQNFAYTMESLKSITRMPSAGGGKAIVSDINKDGFKDLLFTNMLHGSTLAELPSYIYWGGSDGLNPLRRSLLPADRGTAIAVDDLTGDGLPDIVIANVGREHMYGETPDYSYQTLGKRAGDRELTSYIFTQTDAGFPPNARAAIPTQYAVDVKIADFTNDGRKSIVFLELGNPGAVRIIPTTGGKAGKAQILPVLNIRFSPSWGKRLTPELLVKDLNGDGYADLFVPSTGNKSEIFWNAKGSFSEENKSIVETQNAFSGDAADLNGDGYIDLVTANFYSVNEKEAYDFETDSHIWWGSKEGFSIKKRMALPTMGAVSVRLADLDGTGLTDILFAQHRNNQTLDINSFIYHNSAAGFATENRTELQSFGATSILAEDLSSKGRKDVIIINGLSGIARHAGINDGPGNEGISAEGLPMYIYKGNASGRYGPANCIRVPLASQESNIAFADMEDKGSVDLVYLRGNNQRITIRYNIYNFPQEKELTEVDIPFRGNTINVADFNKDGILDMLVTPVNGPTGAIVFGLGNRKFKVELFDFPFMAYTTSLGDLNNDGLLDAVTCGYNRVCIMFGENNGGYHLQKPIILFSEMFTPRVSMADFNNDGWLDILCQNLQNFDTKVYDVESWVLISNKGTFSLNNKRSFHTFGANGGTIAQLYSDGKLQFVAANYHADESRRSPTFILSGDKDGFPTEEKKIRLPSYSSGGNLVLDFNGDGYQDILVYNHTGATVYDGGINATGGKHGVGSVIYWGGKDGYRVDNTSSVPSFGPHSRIAADAGSIARRNSYEVYTSDYMVNTTGEKKFILSVQGRFSNKQFVTPEILIGKSGSSMRTNTEKPQLISQSASEAVYDISIEKGQTFRYQLKLNSSNSGGGPVVSSVKMEVAIK